MNPYADAMKNIEKMRERAQMNPSGMTPQQVQSMVMPGTVPPNPTGMNMSQMGNMVMGTPNPTGMSPTEIADTVSPADRNLGGSGFSPEQLMSALHQADPTLFDAPDAPDPVVFNGNNVMMPGAAPQGKSMTQGIMGLMQAMQMGNK